MLKTGLISSRDARPAAPRVIRGSREVLACAPLLARFAALCDQEGAAADLAYFLHKPGILRRSPVLLLFPHVQRKSLAALSPEDLDGAVLLYEYKLTAVPTGIYSSNDRSGRSTLLAPPHRRSEICARATSFLLGAGAHMILISFRSDQPVEEQAPRFLGRHASRAQWTSRSREIPEYLALRATYDETLASIGQRTRSNLRYTRRRAEKELGCRFIPEVRLSTDDLLAFNRHCMYAVPDSVAAWRHSALRTLESPFLMGIQDGDGNWLSLVGGRRVNGHSEILWQLNRDGLPQYSVSLVMRGYLIEHEIGRGATRFYIEGGSPHPIRHSFLPGSITDFAVLRRSLPAYMIRRLSRHLVEEENELAQLLFDDLVKWQTGSRVRVPALTHPVGDQAATSPDLRVAGNR